MFATRAEVDLDALTLNYHHIRKQLPSYVKIAGVIKSNAYGHDLLTIATHLIDLEVDYIATATFREAFAVRRHHKAIPILIMGITLESDYEKAVSDGLTLTIFNLSSASKINEIALKMKKKARVHIKMDTGFNRIGYKDFDRAFVEIQEIVKMDAIELEGIFTHLALKDPASDQIQLEAFDIFLKRLKNAGIRIPLTHACDSIGAAAYPKLPYTMVRVGASLYGYNSRTLPFELRPVMTFKTIVSHIKSIEMGEAVSYDGTFVAKQKTLVGTLPVGYGDGLPRQLSNRGYVVVNGKKAPIIGLVCMDQCMIDISDIENVTIGDSVTLFGDHNLPLSIVSEWAGTNKNAILSGITSRVPRLIIKNNQCTKIVDYLDDL